MLKLLKVGVIVTAIIAAAKLIADSGKSDSEKDETNIIEKIVEGVKKVAKESVVVVGDFIDVIKRLFSTKNAKIMLSTTLTGMAAGAIIICLRS